MSKQRDIFLNGEGNAWHSRNARGGRCGSLYARVFAGMTSPPGRVLEIGCSAGHNLHMLHSSFGVETYGVDPSAEAIRAGMSEFPHLRLSIGTADSLPYEDAFFDCVIFGFCLLYCDRNLLFTIAAEADRALCAPGYLLILDFFPPAPYRNTYHHKTGLFSYKMDYSAMFLWNPMYTMVSLTPLTHCGETFDEHPDERLALITLAKRNDEQYSITDPYV